ncbi:hypothetical protein COCON_G00234620, partial [Conger conger]
MEVFIEMGASKLWGEGGRWLVIVLIQISKAILRILLLFCYKSGIQTSPPIAPLDREMQLNRGENLNQQEDPVFVGQRSGRAMRPLGSAPSPHARLWGVHRPEQMVATPKEELHPGPTPLGLLETVAESLYIGRPLVHLLCLGICGRKSWKPWLISGIIEVTRKYIHRSSRRSFHHDDTKPIRSFWSSIPRPARKPTGGRSSVLVSLARSANASIKPNKNNLNFGLFNIRSLTNKGLLLHDLLKDRKFDFLCLTETWQQPNDFSQLNQTIPPGFVYICQPRPSGRGGGLAILYNEKWKVSSLTVPVHRSFESVALQINGPTPTILVTVYRPPKPSREFLNEFSAFLTSLCSLSPNIILLGDFNIHMDNVNNTLTKDFTSCLDSSGLQQYIDFPTHSKGHILDLVCCSGVTPLNCTASDLPISDHKFVSFNVSLKLPKTNMLRSISFRNINNIDLSALSSGIDNLPSKDNLSTPDELVSFYNDELHSLLNAHAPLKTRSVSFTHSAPWFTPELRQFKTKGRRLERLYAKTGLVVHKDMYDSHILSYKDALSTAKCAYYANLIRMGEGNTRALFSTVKTILRPPDTLAPHMYSTAQCNTFMTFFDAKIENIHQQLTSSINTTYSSLYSPSDVSVLSSLSNFELPTVGEISGLIRKSKSSTCQLDPLPTHLVKACLPSLSSLITAIIHSSLTSGLVPSSLKTAAITPILKKPGADPNNLSNFRPISNLPFLTKILEKIVAAQVQAHMTNNNLFEQFQSGFRSFHSTETALVKITNDLLMAADSGLLTILVLLDLSAAFDTISHNILLERLASLGITGTSLVWFTSYLSGRTQFVQLK